MTIGDTEAVTNLLPDLGYEGTVADVVRRFACVASRPEHGLFVAEWQGAIVGWTHIYGVCLLESDGYAEIGGLVVASDYRRKGIGQKLVGAAEVWAANQGHTRIRLRSGVHRDEAHQFYESLGYAKSRASFAFERHVSINSMA